MDAIAAFADHVVATRTRDMPDAALGAAKVFILDTLGVGIAGSSGPWAGEVAGLQGTWGEGHQARVWGSGQHLPAPAAAMCNAYQAHNSEFDCVHEQAVVHAMSIVLPVALAGAERLGGISGEALMGAVVLGVDVAAGLGVAATSGLQFFRPATTGALGGAAALGRLLGFDQARMVNALSIAYGQCCGTMQAHTEGSPLLALQMGFNARNAVVACDLAARGFEGPKDVLEGPFGYFKLIEAGGVPQRVAEELGRRWFITELAHKPFPTGRATHGVIEACMDLRHAPGFAVAAIERVTARVPPLVHRLVGRPPQEGMNINYARLCVRYLAARALLHGGVGPGDFTREAYADPPTQDLARRVALEVVDAGDPNALTPVSVELAQRGAPAQTVGIEVVLGNPARPLSRSDQRDKFRRNCQAAIRPLPPETVQRLVEQVDRLERLADVGGLADLLSA